MLKPDTQNRGVVYVVWGSIFNELLASVKSVEKQGLPICVIADNTIDLSSLPTSCDVRRVAFPKHMEGFSRKIKMFQYSPFEETLYLDTDCLVLDDLNMGFRKLEHYDICLCHAPSYYLPLNEKEVAHYNTGVFFFAKNEITKQVFQKWEQNKLPDEFEYDQHGLASVLDDLNPKVFCLPPTWNFRPQFHNDTVHGPIKIWHSKPGLNPSAVEKIISYNKQIDRSNPHHKRVDLSASNRDRTCTH